MGVLRRTFSSRAMRIHSVVFLVGVVAVAILDWAQGVDSESTFLGLDWAHLILVIWVPIFIVHALSSWWGGEVDDLDNDTMKQIRGRWV